MSHDTLLDTDADRDDRNRRFYGSDALQTLAAARVMVVGAGAVGNEICKHLGMVGVGEILLVDPDVVSDSNLNRCVLFQPGQGREQLPKVDAIRRAFERHGFATRVDARACPLEEVPLDDWSAVELVVCGVDDDHARHFLNKHLLAAALVSDESRFVIEGAMGSDFTQCRILEVPRTACLCCNWTTDLLAAVMNRQRLRSCQEFFVDTRRVFPAVSTQTSQVSALMATEAIRILTGLPYYRTNGQWPTDGSSRGDPLIGRLLRHETPTAQLLVAEIVRNPRCIEPYCRQP